MLLRIARDRRHKTYAYLLASSDQMYLIFFTISVLCHRFYFS